MPAVAAALMRSGMRTSFAFAVWAFAGIASLLVHRKVLLPPTRCCVVRLLFVEHVELRWFVTGPCVRACLHNA